MSYRQDFYRDNGSSLRNQQNKGSQHHNLANLGRANRKMPTQQSRYAHMRNEEYRRRAAMVARRRKLRRRRALARLISFVVVLLLVATALLMLWQQKSKIQGGFTKMASFFTAFAEEGEHKQIFSSKKLKKEKNKTSQADPDQETTDGINHQSSQALSPYAADGLDFRLDSELPYYFEDQRAIVLIDPGHGGYDGGAADYLGGGTQVTEAEIVLEIALKLKEELSLHNIEAYLIRDSDTFVSLYGRVARASTLALDYMSAYQPELVADRDFVERMKEQLLVPIEINSDGTGSGGFGFMKGYGMSSSQMQLLDLQGHCQNVVFVSLHCNGHKYDYSLHGMQAYYCSDAHVEQDEAAGLAQQTEPIGNGVYRGRDDDRNKLLAQSIYDQTISEVPEFGDTNAGKPVLPGNYAVLREHGLASTLLEIAYLTNSNDLRLLIDEQVQGRVASGIAKGINEYFSQILLS